MPWHAAAQDVTADCAQLVVLGHVETFDGLGQLLVLVGIDVAIVEGVYAGVMLFG